MEFRHEVAQHQLVCLDENMGDVINGNYNMHTNTGLNVVKSYCDLAIIRTC